MIYGSTQAVIVNDFTDLIGIRNLVLSKMWQPSRGNLSQKELDSEKPAPPEVSPALMLVGEQTQQSKGGMRTLWTFTGINGDGKSVTFKDRKNSIDYGFEAGFAQVSIQRHPDFENLLKTYGGWPDNDGGRVLWPPTISPAATNGLPGDGGNKSKDNPMFGVNEFFQMEGTYRFRYASRDLPKDLLTGVGKVFEKYLPGQPPELTEKRNWLMLPPNYRRRGIIFDITEQYWLSGRGGWSIPVYGEAM